MTPLPPNPDSPEAKRVQCDKCGAWQDERTCCGFCGRAIGFDTPSPPPHQGAAQEFEKRAASFEIAEAAAEDKGEREVRDEMSAIATTYRICAAELRPPHTPRGLK